MCRTGNREDNGHGSKSKEIMRKLVEPGRVLIITYSRRAADEIREHLKRTELPW